MPAEIGAPAPTFTLRDQDKNEVSLESFQGRNTVLVFIPFPFTSICDGEVCEIRDNLSRFEELDANVAVITAHALQTNKQWAATEGLEFPVLSDFWPHGDISRDYGVFNPRKGLATRGTFLIDAEGVVRWSVVNPTGEARDVEDYRREVTALLG